MPLYMDVHRNIDATPQDVERAHLSDLEAQDRYGVKYIKYWIDPGRHTICCLVEGPNPEACAAVHREAHGLLADQIIEVETNLVEGFLGGQSSTPIGGAMYNDGSLDTAYRVILFTDIAGSTSATQKLGDAQAMEMVRTHDRIVREALQDHGGREIKHTGDGIMASFISASYAVRTAIDIQKRIAEHNREKPDLAFGVRIGMSAGEPVVENEDFFGAAVQLARRVCDSAEAGRVYASNVVRELCIGKGFGFLDLGERELKGFEGAVRLYEVPIR
jgi:class 3 adenylate cyclase